MKRIVLTLVVLILTFVVAFAKPVFSKSKYLIATLYDNATGTLSPGNTTCPLVCNADRDEVTALEEDYWIIRNISGDQYTFQNASTGKYIRYNSAVTSERSALVLVDALQSDNSTSFTLELKTTNGLCYYIIRSVVNTAKIWDRRTAAYSSVYPVGVYSGYGSTNELFVFYDTSGNPVVDEVPVVLPTANKTLGAFNSYLKTFTINGKTPVVDTSNKEFYASLPDSLITTSQSLPVVFLPKNAAYKLYINNIEVTSGSVFNFGAITATQKYTLEIKNGISSLASGALYFSGLPFVQLYTDATIGTVYSLARIAVTDPLKSDTAEVVLTKLKTRGGISSNYAKKSLAINLRDSLGFNSADRSYFALRNDNNWILDAMYIDPGRMRNRVNTDLWNDFSAKPYWYLNEPKMHNGTRGHFVEVFQNDAYLGLYCMTERVDRKQLNLKKLKSITDSLTKTTIYTQRGTTIKGVGWSSAVLMGYPYGGSSIYPAFSNTSSVWSSYECKYPELDEGEPIMWDNLYTALKLPDSYYTSDADFAGKVAGFFDLPVYLDYYLFMELVLATDNHGKNTFTSIYDQTVSNKVSLTPWDMDGTWGIRWEGSKKLTGAEQDFDSFLINNEHGQLNLFLRLKNLNVNAWNNQLKDRYLALRKYYFSYDNMIGRFRKYADLFIKSGAATREINKWGSYGLVTNIESEMTFLSTWMTARLKYLDNKYLGAPYSALNNIQAGGKILLVPNPVESLLNVSGLQLSQVVSVYTLQGILLDCRTATDNTMQIDMTGYKPGVYLIKIGNYTLKIVRK